jgi:predicted lipoprotein with Yx(FWY)xxD motif
LVSRSCDQHCFEEEDMRLKIALTALVLVAAACGGDDAADVETTAAPTTAAPATGAPTTEARTTEAPTTEAPTTEAPTTEAPTTEPPAAAAAVALVGSDLGDILVDGDGNTLYLFVSDAQGPSVCNDGCAQAWPPLIGEVAAGEGVDSALLATAARDDGSEQATYNGWPLYYYANDAAAGDTNGQTVNEVWYVLDAGGDGIGLPGVEAAAATVALVESGLGGILVDGDGNTLYLFVPDAQGPSVCNDGCAEAWPPFIGETVASDGVDAALLGVATRDDGSEQATYNDWPLYYFANDAAAGDTNGQGVNEVWYVLDASGDGIN